MVDSLSWHRRSYFTATLGLLSTIKIINRGRDLAQRATARAWQPHIASVDPVALSYDL